MIEVHCKIISVLNIISQSTISIKNLKYSEYLRPFLQLLNLAELFLVPVTEV